jgi:transcriptional regulator with XRE-family HTH domain
MTRYDTQPRLGALIQAQREDRGWSIRKLAKCAGLAAATVSQIETGDADPRLSTMEKIAEALGHDLSDFLRYTR